MSQSRKPVVFRIKPEQERERKMPSANRPSMHGVVLAETPDAFAEKAVLPTADEVLHPRQSSFSFWNKLFWSALTGLLSLALGLWFWRLVDELFRTSPIAGWIGLALLCLAILALLVLVVREIRGLSRLNAVTAIRSESEQAFANDDGDKARDIIRRLMQFQSNDPSTAAQRTTMTEYMDEIIDGRGLLTLADRTLLQSRDERAKAVIASAAKRVSVVTAISPRALVDVLFVAAQSVMLTRRIAEIYGTRPGNLGFLRLARKILGHLAITGGVAISDSVLSQLVGHGLAARLSAKLGEGVLNGLLTARVGLACIAACRPLPFLASQEPKLQDVAGEILSNPFGHKG
jgi:putative membrane protein